MKDTKLEKITISENVKNKFFNGLKIGLDLEESLLFSNISKYDFLKIYNYSNLFSLYNFLINNNLYIYINNLDILTNLVNNNIEDSNYNNNIIISSKELKLSLIKDNLLNKKYISNNIELLKSINKDKNIKDYLMSCYEFIQETKRCKIELQYKLLNDLQESENRNTTTGASFLLERLFKAKFGKEAETEEEEKTLPPITITFSNVQDQQQRLNEIENIVSLELNADTKKA